MSKISRLFLLTIALSVLILQLFNKSSGQDMDIRLRVDAAKASVHIEGEFQSVPFSQPLTFLSNYAGVALPLERISNVRHNGNSWSYDVDVARVKDGGIGPHVSWISPEGGVLMLDDLIPQPTRKKTVKIGMLLFPTGWNESVSRAADRIDGFQDAEKAVVITGPSLRSIRYDSSRRAALVMSGQWMFSDNDAMESAREVFAVYGRVFADSRENKSLIALIRSPTHAPPDIWAADTRGSTITIVSSDTSFRTQSLQRLHEQLRHEMFHLWIPEGVNLTGHYDWFYEGFALYQSLKLGIATNRIRFDDYLDTLSRAYDIDRRLGSSLSLIDASKNRWSGDNNTVVYSRGMLVAFLCDLALMNASKGKLSTDDIVREIYRRHSGNAPAKDGNDAVISILKDHRELVPIVDENVSGTKQIDWSALITAAGLQAGTVVSGVTTLKVIQKPSGSQKRLLDELGYNNWRKLKLK